jgi:signal peptidase II
MLKRIFVLLVLLVSCIGCDQVTKKAAAQWLEGEPVRSYLGDSFRLLYAENTGAFLGMGSDWPDFVRYGLFTILSMVAVGFALGWVIRRVATTGGFRPYGQTLGALLLAAGGIGNLIDRVMREGAVIDFMNMGIGSLRTGIFNIADVQIMVGVALFAFWRAPPGETHSADPPLEPKHR